MRKVISIVFLVIILLSIAAPMGTSALEDYSYYIPVTFTNSTGSDITGRYVFTFNPSGLISGGFMQTDADDYRFDTESDTSTLLSTATELDGTTSAFTTDVFIVPANSSVIKYIWIGNPGATARDQSWMAARGDTVTVSDAASLDITTDLTLEADVTLPSTIDMDRSVYTDTEDGYLYYNNGTYLTCRNNATGTLLESSSYTTASVGQNVGYYIYRSFVFFDTSFLVDEPSAASIFIYGYSDNSTTDFDLTVVMGNDSTMPNYPLQTEDYDVSDFEDKGSGGTLNTSLWDDAGYNEIALNSTALDYIEKNGEDDGITGFGIFSGEDLASSAPADAEYVAFYTYDIGDLTKTPYLELTLSRLPIITKPGAYDLSFDGTNWMMRIYATNTPGTSSSDGYLYATDSDYAALQAQANADSVLTSFDYIYIGQSDAGVNETIYRAALYFDTSSLSGVPDTASLWFYGYSDGSTTDFDIVVQYNAAGTYPSNPLVVTDYDDSFYTGNGGSLNTSVFDDSGWNEIALNADGRDMLNAGGTTKLMLRSLEDINASDPGGINEYVRIYSEDEGSGKEAYLEYPVTYEAAAALTKGSEVTVTGEYDGANVTVTDGTHNDSEAVATSISTTATDIIINGFDGKVDNTTIEDNGTAVLDLSYEADEISDTTIEDQSASANDASFTLASNPSGITVTVGGLVSTSSAFTTSATGITGEDAAGEIAGHGRDTSEIGSGVPSGSVPDLMADAVADSTGVNLRWIWISVYGVIALGLFIFSVGQFGASPAVGWFMVAIWSALCYQPWHIVPWWMVVMMIIFGLGHSAWRNRTTY